MKIQSQIRKAYKDQAKARIVWALADGERPDYPALTALIPDAVWRRLPAPLIAELIQSLRAGIGPAQADTKRASS